MDYKPYTIEWSRKRYLSESILKYFEDGVSADIIITDIVDILDEYEKSLEEKYLRFKKVKDYFLTENE